MDVIRFVELETQAPSEMIAASLLGVMSQACQDVFDVAPNEKLRFPVSLYQIIVAESGERKSAVDKIIMRSIRELEDELEIKYRDQKNEHEKNSRLWVVKSRALEKVIKAAVSTGLTHQCLYFEQPHTFEQILLIQTAEPALVGHA